MDNRPRFLAAAIFGFLLFSAGKIVFLGNRLQALTPALFLAWSFLIVTASYVLRLGPRTSVRKALSEGGAFAILNLLTLVNWATYYYAVQRIEPSMAAAMASTGPMVYAFAAKGRGRHWRWLFCAALLMYSVLCAVILQETLSGRSAVGEVSQSAAILGVALSMACGLSAFSYTVYTSRLHERGWAESEVLALRFPLTVVCAFAVLATGESGLVLPAGVIPDVVLVAVLGVLLPISMFQFVVAKGGVRLGSWTHALLPLSIAGVQLLDRRLDFRVGSTALVLAMSLISLASIAIRLRSASPKSP